jgi:hypothetical protein
MEQETVYQALVKAAKAADSNFEEKRTTETHEQYMYRLLELIGDQEKVTEQIWEEMGTEAAKWFNAAVAELSATNQYIDCPGYITTQKQPEPIVSTNSDNKVRKTGIMMKIRQAALQNPDMGWESLTEKLRADGLEVKGNTVWVCVEEVKNVRRAIQALGGAITLPVN